MECCCFLRNIQDLLSDGKAPYERRFGKQRISLFVVPKRPSQDRILQCTVEQVIRCSGDDRRTVGGCVDIVSQDIVSQDRTQQRTLMQISDLPVPQVVMELVKVFTVSPKIWFVELIFETPATSLAEKISEKVVNTHVEHVVNTVKVVTERSTIKPAA